jgi:hypothetical protein
MFRTFVVLGASIVWILTGGSARAQAPTCEQMLYALTTAPPGTYSPDQAQVIANAYNANCLAQQYQPQYQQPPQQYYSQQSDEDRNAEAAGEALGAFIGGLMRR